uniref:Enoyl-CoA hydratase n=1 Tax=Chromera velia CCMP2878 TaxID=1169474 RepID=A0A0G4FNS5_9ALVE|eukprot:Cvel_17931.t1-p1 / transcript=Cvel_17931.t1 / gene=Cvel_17931 / organism=Chromera_velia_CCMP2878 / gene_product=Carnitinyl-CoA dehydratase, putative / transcript_product=Carnitinyl-CoA dehydratase, putative / location=Cvel_scaffold1457:35546-38284(+) / protein_length=282 / sequence_SO=supercontig / SO=protein_coding / is_pseudo=false
MAPFVEYKKGDGKHGEHQHIRRIILNRPDARNAVNAEVAQQMEAALDAFENDDDAWVAVLCARGPVFCAGADLKAISDSRGGTIFTEKGGFAGFVRYPRRKPVVAAVEGPCFAGGLELALACDFIVASSAASFGLPEVKRSLVAAAGGLFRLPSRIPTNEAMMMVLTGDPIDARRAYQLGLVQRLTPPGAAEAEALDAARRIALNAPVAVALSRQVARTPGEGPSEAQGWEASEEAWARVSSSADHAEGPRAFVEKRAPRWKGWESVEERERLVPLPSTSRL